MKKNNYLLKLGLWKMLKQLILGSIWCYLACQPIIFAEQITSMELKPILVFDNLNTAAKNAPKNYRQGLDLDPKLYASASAQPNLADLEYIRSVAQAALPRSASSKIFIIDLRQEPHVFVNDQTVSWYGVQNRTPYTLEGHLLQELSTASTIKIYTKFKKLPMGRTIPTAFKVVTPTKVLPEQAVVEQLGLNYLRILVTDHSAPDPKQVDLFIEFFKKLSQPSWLHFHCRGGKGRSTTFMTMVDLLQNAPALTLEQILARQQLLGGIDLAKTNLRSYRKKWKQPEAVKRYTFIKNFYAYIVDPNGYKKILWSEWIRLNKYS